MGLLAALDTLIREHGSASIRADQILLLRDQIADLDSKSSVLASENTVLERQNTELQSQLDKAKITIREFSELNQFTESHGAYFKKDGRGGYHDAVYCYDCRLSTTLEGQGSPANQKFTCKCGWKSPFRLRDVHSIRESL